MAIRKFRKGNFSARFWDDAGWWGVRKPSCLWISHLLVLTTSRVIPHFVAAYFIDWIFIKYIKSLLLGKWFRTKSRVLSFVAWDFSFKRFFNLRKSRVGLSAGRPQWNPSRNTMGWWDGGRPRGFLTERWWEKYSDTWKWRCNFPFGVFMPVFRGVFSLLVSGNVREFSSPKRSNWTDPVLKTLLKRGIVFRYNPPKAPVPVKLDLPLVKLHRSYCLQKSWLPTRRTLIVPKTHSNLWRTLMDYVMSSFPQRKNRKGKSMWRYFLVDWLLVWTWGNKYHLGYPKEHYLGRFLQHFS